VAWEAVTSYDLAASAAPCPLRLDGVVDGMNRPLTPDRISNHYKPAFETYQRRGAKIVLTADRSNVAHWLLYGGNK